MKNKIQLLGKGFCIGLANAIPGVSGGTIAFLMGIYEPLINSINQFDLQFFRALFSGDRKTALKKIPWEFLFLVGSGAVLAILSLSKLLVWLLKNHPVQINAFFFGLILATVPIMARIIERWTVGKVIAAVAATIITYFIVNLVPMQTPNALWFIFICGFVAISSMILPGISGSFMLLILGKYFYIMEAINQRQLAVLAVFSLGMVTGIILFVRLLNFLFKKFHDLTVAVLTGFVLGSLDKIWPWKKILNAIDKGHGDVIVLKQINMLPNTFNSGFFIAVLLVVVGFVLAICLNTSPKGKIL